MEISADPIEIRVISEPPKITEVEGLQVKVWGDTPVPMHMMLAIISNGGILLGAYNQEELVGFVLGIIGIDARGDKTILKHHSHMMGIDPDHRDKGIGYKLKRAQWQLVRQQGIELITWTFNPLESRNAYLNIAKLGAVCNTYKRDIYGPMEDKLNRGVASDRFLVELWVNSERVNRRLSRESRRPLDLAHYLAADAVVVNATKNNAAGWPVPFSDDMDKLDGPDGRPPLVLFEIPPDFQGLLKNDLPLAQEWRMYSRVIFELLFAHGYWITDYVYLPGSSPRNYYVLSLGNATLGVFSNGN